MVWDSLRRWPPAEPGRLARRASFFYIVIGDFDMRMIWISCSEFLKSDRLGRLRQAWYWPGERGHPQPEGWYHGDNIGPFSEQTDCWRDAAIRDAVQKHVVGKAVWGYKGDGVLLVEWIDHENNVEHWIAGRPVNDTPGDIISFRMYHEEFMKFMNGELIQTAMPNASDTEREFLLSGIWAPGNVWDELMSGEVELNVE